MLSSRDREDVAWQLGRPPVAAIGVAYRCPYGYPQVVLTHPLRRDGERFIVFPTLFWLSCPYLTVRVSRLESEGGVKRWESLLSEDPDLATRYRASQDAYRRERRALLSPEEQEFLRGVNALDRLETGIGGLANLNRVKCLHAQLAHFLARGGNPIGEAVAADLGSLSCPPERVECAAARRAAKL